MLKEERQKLILEKLNTAQKINFVELSELLDVSYDSIRRDVIELEDKGLLKKVHGGIIANSYLSILGNQRNNIAQSDELPILFKKAQKLLDNQPVILMDGGTTNYFMAENLPKNLEATIITNSPPLAMTLIEHTKIEVILLGGTFFKRYQISIGNSVMQQLEHIHPDIYFMGVNGIHATAGLTIRHYEESLLKRKMMESAKKTVCCVIAEKINMEENYKVADFNEIDILITSLKPTDSILGDFAGKGVEIL
jgi:DeoR/GlpR family transcriptional regulator of sugar metabolism